LSKRLIIAGYPGVGKTRYCGSHPEAVDFDSHSYKDLFGTKATLSNVKLPKNWYEYYVEDAISLLDTYEVVFISTHKEVLKELDKQSSAKGVHAVVLFPDRKLKDWWIDNLKIRKNVSNKPGDIKAYDHVQANFDSDLNDMKEATEYSEMLGARITDKAYRLEDIVKELQNFFDDDTEERIDPHSLNLVPVKGEGRSEFDTVEAIKSLYEEIDKIKKVLSQTTPKEDDYVWPKENIRDHKYMDSFFQSLMEIWEKFPEMRFGQLIGNVVQDPVSYYMEDDKLVETLKKYYDNLMGNEDGRKD